MHVFHVIHIQKDDDLGQHLFRGPEQGHRKIRRLAEKEQGNLSDSIYMRVIDCSLVLRAWVVCVDLGFSLVDRGLSLGSTGDNLLEAL